MKVGAQSLGERKGVENSIGSFTHNVFPKSVPPILSMRNLRWVGLETGSFST